MSRLRPKMSGNPTMNIFRASIPEPRMICISERIMKAATNTRIAPLPAWASNIGRAGSLRCNFFHLML